ncbi:MAG: glycosyltransferase family 4 protein [Thermoleophilia bacterium]|nr:glycosyltransferase family 4 protein [Thermoleophilia bacterium]
MAATPQRRRVLVVSNDVVGRSMAGPGIRYYHFARELARHHEVTLAVPQPVDIELDGIQTVVWRGLRTPELKRLCEGFDALVAQQLPPRVMRHLARTRVRAVYDLYDPYLLENLGFYAARERGDGVERLEHRSGGLLQEIALATGDAFVCASERQRDLWLGMLGVLDRIDLDRYAGDEQLRGLVDVVPFGLDPEPPRAAAGALKGVVPGIAAGDRVLLWGGGVWNWLDPLTPIRAVGRLAERRDDVKLYFLGLRHPNPDVAEMAMAQRAVDLAQELGLRDRHVFFNFGWVPYAERHGYLLDADLGVSAHLDTVEARFAFRTRIVDYFWAGLPVVATRGDALAELVEERGLGRALEFGDVDGWAAAIEGLLDDAEAHARARAELARVREQFAWPRLVERLAALVEAPPGRRAPRRADALVLRHLWLYGRMFQRRAGTRSVLEHAALAVLIKAGLVDPSPGARSRWRLGGRRPPDGRR